MKNSIIVLFLSSAIFYSCDNSSNSTEETNGEIASTQTSSKGSCVFDYMDKYDQLLPLDAIKKHYTGDLSAAKMKYNKSEEADRQNHDSYMYTWPSDRVKVMNFGGGDMEVPLRNEIGIEWLGDDLYKINGIKDPIASFKNFYRTVSQEELNAAMGKAEAEISKDKNISKETKDEAMGMAKGMSTGAKYEDVSGFGNAASWDARDNNLIILIGDKTFKVKAAISADSETNKALAMKLATEVLAKCN